MECYFLEVSKPFQICFIFIRLNGNPVSMKYSEVKGNEYNSLKLKISLTKFGLEKSKTRTGYYRNPQDALKIVFTKCYDGKIRLEKLLFLLQNIMVFFFLLLKPVVSLNLCNHSLGFELRLTYLQCK